MTSDLIYPDPLEIASDEELKNKVLQQITQKLSNKMFVSLKKYGYKYFAAAERSKTEGKHKDAVENYINFIYSFQGTDEYASEMKQATEYLLQRR